jgi:hypothetical protein
MKEPILVTEVDSTVLNSVAAELSGIVMHGVSELSGIDIDKVRKLVAPVVVLACLCWACSGYH